MAVDEEVGLRVPLGQLLVALAHDVGQVAEAGHDLGPSDRHEGAVEHHLARGRGQQVLAAQDVGDAHGGVVHRVDQRVQGVAVGTHDDVVGHGARLEGDGAAHEVVEGDVLVGHAQTQDGLPPLGAEGRLLLLGEVAVEAVVAELGVPPAGAVALLHLLRGGEGLVEVAGLKQLGGDLRVQPHALGLAVGLVGAALADSLVPVQAEPGQGVEDRVEGLLRVAGGVGVLNAEDEGAAGVARVGPVEQAGAHHADVRGARRGGAEAHTDGRGALGRNGGCLRDVGGSHDAPSLAPGPRPPGPQRRPAPVARSCLDSCP